VFAGVKLEIGTPYPDTPDEGGLMINTELIPLSNPEFESGPPGIQAIELSRVVDRGIRESKAIDMKKLCIEPKEKVWTVIVDIIPINDEGNYVLTERGFNALQAVETSSKYIWLRAAHRRSFFLSLMVSIMGNIYILWIVSHLNDYTLWYAFVLPATVAWMIFYSYWTFVKRRIRLRQ